MPFVLFIQNRGEKRNTPADIYFNSILCSLSWVYWVTNSMVAVFRALCVIISYADALKVFWLQMKGQTHSVKSSLPLCLLLWLCRGIYHFILFITSNAHYHNIKYKVVNITNHKNLNNIAITFIIIHIKEYILNTLLENTK